MEQDRAPCFVRWRILVAVGLSSCGTPSKSKLLKMPKLDNVPIVGKNRRKPKPEPEAQGGGPLAKVQAKASLRGGGAVEFRGFSAAALKDFRLIPEKDADLFAPQNQVYQGVDGFLVEASTGHVVQDPESLQRCGASRAGGGDAECLHDLDR